MRMRRAAKRALKGPLTPRRQLIFFHLALANREFGGLKLDQVKRMKELEAENARLRRAVSDLTLDKMILAEAAKGNF